jgi:hypothetical protein
MSFMKSWWRISNGENKKRVACETDASGRGEDPDFASPGILASLTGRRAS